MARRRYQKTGHLYFRGGKWWVSFRPAHRRKGVDCKVTREVGTANALYVPRKDERGATVGWDRQGAVTHRGGLNYRQAQQVAWDQHLSKLHEQTLRPTSGEPVSAFWSRVYIPSLELREIRRNTLDQYASLWEQWISPAIGSLALRDVTRQDAQQLLAAAKAEGKSPATVHHIRKVGSALFNLAIDEDAIQRNPFSRVSLPTVRAVRERYAVTMEQAWRIVLAVPEFYRPPVLFAFLTGMNVAEIAGLRWEHVLKDRIQIREQWSRNRRGPCKTGARERELPITDRMREVLYGIPQRGGSVFAGGLSRLDTEDGGLEPGGGTVALARRSSKVSDSKAPTIARGGETTAPRRPDLPVFPAPMSGYRVVPIDAHNIQRRHLSPAGAALGLDSFGWHLCRHSVATWLDELEIRESVRQAILGHASKSMTARYTHASLDRLRDALERLHERFYAARPARAAVIEMGRRTG